MRNLADSNEIKVSKAEIKRIVAQFEKVGAIPSVAFTDKRKETNIMKIDLKNLYGSSFEEYYNFKNEHFAHPIMEVVKSKVKSRKCGVLYKDTFDMLRDKDFTLFGNVLLRIPKYKEYLTQIKKEVVAEHYNNCPTSKILNLLINVLYVKHSLMPFVGLLKKNY